MLKSNTKTFMTILILLGVLLLMVIISLCVGAANIPLNETVKALLTDVDSPNRKILMNIRLPRILLVAIVGTALATVGAVMQGIFKNPLVDAYTLGMSSGASLGAVISIIAGINLQFAGFSATGIFAFLGAITALLTVYGLSLAGNRVTVTYLLLAGVVISYFLSSVISLLMMLNHDKIEHIIFWTMGSFSFSTWNKVTAAYPVILAGVLVLAYFSRELNILSINEETAYHLGVSIEKVKMILLITAAVVVGAAVSSAGTIGFIGLIVPHIIRMLTGANHRTLIPFSAIGGAIVLLLADTLARTVIQPTELPIGVITSILGCPFFVFLLKRKRAHFL